MGEILSAESLDEAPVAIERLLAIPGKFRDEVRILREQKVFRLGHSIPDGAREIARLADKRVQARQQVQMR